MAQQKSKGQLVGIEAKIEYSPALDDLGFFYESYRRTALNWLQSGKTEAQVEKQLQTEKNLPWAWADALALEAKQTYDQLKSALDNQIALLKERIKAKTKHVKETIKDLGKQLKSAIKKGMSPLAYCRFKNEIRGVKPKIWKIGDLQRRLAKLEATERLHICFGSEKLFNAQHHLEANGYANHSEWLEDWQQLRSGRFFGVGKSTHGGGTAIKIFATDEPTIYSCVISLPYDLRTDYGNTINLNFFVDDRDRRNRKADLDYALLTQKPVTVQIFRREHKDDQWYIHLCTYVPEVPIVHNTTNGAIGIDFNRDSIDLAVVSSSGNLNNKLSIPYKWKGLSSGQRSSRMRDIVAGVVRLAETHGCAVAIESLDFSKKKAKMSEESVAYNTMLSNLATDLFRECLESRCKRYGVQLIKVNPAFTSVIGMIKFMAQYGLTSGTSAGMCIARRAMRLSERLPKRLTRPEDLVSPSPWHGWNALSRFMRHNSIRRHKLFDPTKALEGYLRPAKSGGQPPRVGRRKMEKSPSLPVAERVVDTIIAQSPMGRDSHQLSLFDNY